MLTLVLAASLWQAAATAGDRPSALCDIASIGCVEGKGMPVAVEKIADDAARDIAWLLGSHSADLLATAIAIERCDGACAEGNPIGFNPEARIALKMASTASTALTLWKLRRDGHGKTATVVRWVTVAFNAALVVNNTRHAIKGK